MCVVVRVGGSLEVLGERMALGVLATALRWMNRMPVPTMCDH